MILTHENLHAIATGGCGHNAAQLKLLGVAEQRKGWLTSLIGKEITDETYAMLMALKGVKKGKRAAVLAGETPTPVQPAKLDPNCPLFGLEAEKRRADRLGENCRWLSEQIDRIHAVLCPELNGTWQIRAQQCVEAVEKRNRAGGISRETLVSVLGNKEAAAEATEIARQITREVFAKFPFEPQSPEEL